MVISFSTPNISLCVWLHMAHGSRPSGKLRAVTKQPCVTVPGFIYIKNYFASASAPITAKAGGLPGPRGHSVWSSTTCTLFGHWPHGRTVPTTTNWEDGSQPPGFSWTAVLRRQLYATALAPSYVEAFRHVSDHS